jgi:hypothetical protein
MVERHGIMREEASPAWHLMRDDADNHDHNPFVVLRSDFNWNVLKENMRLGGVCV